MSFFNSRIENLEDEMDCALLCKQARRATAIEKSRSSMPRHFARGCYPGELGVKAAREYKRLHQEESLPHGFSRHNGFAPNIRTKIQVREIDENFYHPVDVVSARRTKALDVALRGRSRSVCKFYGSDLGCAKGLACAFIHMKRDEPTIQPAKKPSYSKPQETLKEIPVASRFEPLRCLDTPRAPNSDDFHTHTPETESDTSAMSDFSEPEETQRPKTVRVRITGLTRHVTEEMLRRLIVTAGAVDARNIYSVTLARDDVFGFCTGSATVGFVWWDDSIAIRVQELGYQYSFQQISTEA